MPSMVSGSSGGPVDNPGGPGDPNTGTGSNHVFHSPGGKGANILDSANPSHLHLQNSNRVRLGRAQKGMINPAAPHVKAVRPKAAAASSRTAKGAGGHSVTKTSTRPVHASGTVSAGGLVTGNGQGGAMQLRGRIDAGLLLRFLEQTVVVAVNGEPVGFDSMGQFFPFGHRPTAHGKLPRGASAPDNYTGAPVRAELISYDAVSRTATIARADQPDAPTYGVPVAANITDAQMGLAASVGLISYSDTDPTDAVITYTT